MKGSLFPVRVAVLFSALAAACALTAAAEPLIRDLGGTRIIKSREAPHNILGEACVACHPGEKFDFWLLVYKGKGPRLAVDGAADNGASAERLAEAQARPRNRFNAHDALSCGFCHFDNPSESSPRFLVEVTGLCRLCHPAVQAHRLPEGEALSRVTAAVASGTLPGTGGGIYCLTCHRIHRSTYSMREEYFRVLYRGMVPNPHGSRGLCFTCHPGGVREGTAVSVGERGDVVALCNGCHEMPGVRRAPHVVRAAASESTWRMEYLGYPLEGGKLTCVTCHDEVSHGAADPANPRFLRGGPYPDGEKFCARCHLDAAGARDNPHRQVDGFGRIRYDRCRFCHGEPRDAAAPESVSPIADDTAVCSNCHRLVPHPDVDHIRPITEPMDARRREYEERHKVVLPLGEGKTIRCSTCHNPHAKGVIKGEAGVGAGSLWRVPDFREVCAPCHGRY